MDQIGEADIFIYPGYEFKIISGLLTNFSRATVDGIDAGRGVCPLGFSTDIFMLRLSRCSFELCDSMLILLRHRLGFWAVV